MSTLDRLMLAVDQMEKRSAAIVEQNRASVAIVEQISRIYDNWVHTDRRCTALCEEATSNFQLLAGFSTLDSKLFLLDASLDTSDTYTSSMSLENLRSEYLYMLSHPDHDTNTDRSLSEHTFSSQKAPGRLSVADIYALPSLRGLKASTGRFLLMSHHQVLPGVATKSSIADLKLKPIKCRTAKLYKKKSQYRLSQIYTLNPVADTSFESLEQQHTPSNWDTASKTLPEIDPIGSRYVSKESRVSGFSQSNNLTASTIPTTFENGDDSEINVTIELDKDLEAFHIGDAVSPDRVSASSCLSLSPPLAFDNFDSFLRKSRLDLLAPVQPKSPPKLKRSTSHDSIFGKVKFHNPAEKINLKGNVASPTFESIYCHEKAPHSSQKVLADMIHKSAVPSTSTPTKRPFFFGLGSPLQPTLSHVTSSPPRRNSVSQTLASSFLSLMALSPRPAEDAYGGFGATGFGGRDMGMFAPMIAPIGRPVVYRDESKERKEAREKDNGRKSDNNAGRALEKPPKIHGDESHFNKTAPRAIPGPVTITSEAHKKRQPLQPLSFNGAHSKLRIGSQSAVISHGQSAPIRRPIMTQVSQNLLNEALSSSIR